MNKFEVGDIVRWSGYIGKLPNGADSYFLDPLTGDSAEIIRIDNSTPNYPIRCGNNIMFNPLEIVLASKENKPQEIKSWRLD